MNPQNITLHTVSAIYRGEKASAIYRGGTRHTKAFTYLRAFRRVSLLRKKRIQRNATKKETRKHHSMTSSAAIYSRHLRRARTPPC